MMSKDADRLAGAGIRRLSAASEGTGQLHLFHLSFDNRTNSGPVGARSWGGEATDYG